MRKPAKPGFLPALAHDRKIRISLSPHSLGSRGFSLIEMLVVITLLIFVAGFGLIVSIESFRASSFRTERDTLVALLMHARSRAVNGRCLGSCSSSVSHGVHLAEGEYVVFQGESYEGRSAAYDETISVEYRAVATTTPSLTDITFSPFAATTTATPADIRSITLSDTAGTATSTITISAEGQITWTN